MASLNRHSNYRWGTGIATRACTPHSRLKSPCTLTPAPSTPVKVESVLGWHVPDSQLPPAHTPAIVGYFQTAGPPLFRQKSWPNSKWSFAWSNYKYFSEMTSSKYFILSVYLFDLLLYVLLGNSIDECIWERAALPLSALSVPSHWFSFPAPYPLLNPLNLVL